METTIKERLIKYLDHKGVSQYRFQKTIGASNGYINGLKKSIHATFLFKIQQNYPDLNIKWLLDGKGEMLVDTKPQEQKPTENDIDNYFVEAFSKAETVNNTKKGSEQGNDYSNLYEQIIELKDRIAKMKCQVFIASKCNTFDECREKLEQILLE